MEDTIKPSIEQPKEEFVQGGVTMVNHKDVNVISLQGFLGAKDTTSEEDSALEYIYKFFSDTGIDSMAEVLLNIKNIENKLGISNLGESRIIRLRNYLKIDSQINELLKTKQAYER